MPRVTQEFVVGSTTIPQETVKGLHDELGKLGFPVVRGSGEASGFDAKASGRVKEFQARYGLPTTGNLDPVTGGIMTMAALVATEPDRERVRTALVQAADDQLFNPSTSSNKLYKFWVARYAVMIRDYPLAKRVLPGRVVDVDVADIIDILDSEPRVAKPEVPFPENFYTYRYNLVAPGDLTALLPEHTASAGQRPLNDNPEDDFDLPGPEVPPLPPPNERLKESAKAWLAAIEAWQAGNRFISKREYARAVSSYTLCQQEGLRYFSIFPDYNVTVSGNTLDARIDNAVASLFSGARWAGVVRHGLSWRHRLLSLKELRDFDWRPIVSASQAYQILKADLSGQPSPLGSVTADIRAAQLDARLLVIVLVLVPLARGEANRLRRQYEAARRDFERVLRPSNPTGNSPLNWRCEFIETPFAQLQLAETLFEQAETQYKSRMLVDELTDQTQRTKALDALNQIAQDFRTRNIPGHTGNTTKPLQHLLAAVTYTRVFQVLSDLGAYVPRTKKALTDLHATVAATIKTAPIGSHAFRSLGQTLTLPTVSPIRDSLPSLLDSKHPHQPYLKIEGDRIQGGEPAVISERNPRVYALLLQVQARLLQIWSGFNYLGYPDDHVPTWRFSFLLERARYFAEHAKNAQREYLNFLTNAEREEFQELTASQNVELEKSNVRIETARVEQVGLEVESAKASEEFAQLNAQNAQERFDTYATFDKYADRLMDADSAFLVSSMTEILDEFHPSLSSALESVPVVGGFFSSSERKELEAAQREVEKHNLELAAAEAAQAAVVAQRQRAVAQAGLQVASLQRTAALLRHEHALQNLSFLRNRTLNAEMWYRLSGAIRGVADTYLRYGIEMAFLAEQAYEFEADKRVDVIRFDYDVSDLGDMLAGDFLLRDLDTLEQDLIVGQKLRQQQVKYVLSLAREFPEALQELRDKGVMTFTLRLEQLERRFPGLFNLRISSVEVLPVALMDATRFSLELTQLGSGHVRLKTRAGTPAPTSPPPPPLANTGEWLVGVDADWAVQPRIMGPETTIFSGLSQQNLGGTAAFFAANQRGAFEGLPGASSWKIDLSMKENRIVPDSLVDLLITFTLSGYYDTNLRSAIDRAPRRPLASTTWFSAQQLFPDAHYQFHRSGRMDWQVSNDHLALQGSLGALQNVAVLCVPSQKRPELGRMMCSFPMEFEVSSAGQITLLREMPHITLKTSGLTLTASVTVRDGIVGTFDYGDGTGLTNTLTHTYARPGRYEVLVRLVTQGRLLTEYHAIVVASRQHAVLPPCIVVPQLQATVVDGKVKIRPTMVIPSGEALAVSWQIDGKQPDSGSGPVTFTVEPGRHVLRFAAVRPLKARFYNQQRHVPTVPVAFDSLHLATNRTFDVASGNETTTNLNAFGRHVFGSGPSAALSPIDRWTLELPLDDNPSVVSVSSADTKQHDLGELADVFLALEYKVRDE